MADQQLYQEAQQIKLVSDALEEEEKSNMSSIFASCLQKKEWNMKKLQQAEMEGLMKRIKTKRREHETQREVDCARLLQRNKNIQVVMESKHVSAINQCSGSSRMELTDFSKYLLSPLIHRDFM